MQSSTYLKMEDRAFALKIYKHIFYKIVDEKDFSFKKDSSGKFLMKYRLSPGTKILVLRAACLKSSGISILHLDPDVTGWLRLVKSKSVVQEKA